MVFRASSGSRLCPATELWGPLSCRKHKSLTGACSSEHVTVHPQFQLYFLPSALRASYQEELLGLAPGLGGHKDFNTIPQSILSLLALGLTRLVRRLGGLWQPIERASRLWEPDSEQAAIHGDGSASGPGLNTPFSP